MLPPEDQFPIGTRVRLKDGIDPSFYNGFSRVGNLATIRKRRRDRYGYAQVYVEWDSHDWSYNGTENCWTWQSHFIEAEENQMTEPKDDMEEQVKKVAEGFMKNVFEIIKSANDSDSDPKLEQEPFDDDPEENWDFLTESAMEALAIAPAFFVIALEQIESPESPTIVVPRVFHASREKEYKLIIQSQLAHMLASMQDDSLRDLLQNPDDEE